MAKFGWIIIKGFDDDEGYVVVDNNIYTDYNAAVKAADKCNKNRKSVEEFRWFDNRDEAIAWAGLEEIVTFEENERKAGYPIDPNDWGMELSKNIPLHIYYKRYANVLITTVWQYEQEPLCATPVKVRIV